MRKDAEGRKRKEKEGRNGEERRCEEDYDGGTEGVREREGEEGEAHGKSGAKMKWKSWERMGCTKCVGGGPAE